jgi:hypothetical protein
MEMGDVHMEEMGMSSLKSQRRRSDPFFHSFTVITKDERNILC